MTDKQRSSDQLHPNILHDQVADDNIAPESTTRDQGDAGATPAAGLGAVETEVTPMTPPAAASDEHGKRNDDDTFDPHTEVTSGGS